MSAPMKDLLEAKADFTTDTTISAEASETIKIKKRSRPLSNNNARKKNSIDEHNNGDNDKNAVDDKEDAEEVDLSHLTAIKNSQQARQRKHGLYISDEVDYIRKGKTVPKLKTTAKSAVQMDDTTATTLDNQFVSKLDYGLGSDNATVTHENVMEQYINEKLGRNKDGT